MRGADLNTHACKNSKHASKDTSKQASKQAGKQATERTAETRTLREAFPLGGSGAVPDGAGAGLQAARPRIGATAR